MNYTEVIIETADQLKALEDKQKLVQFQKRICFLRLLKTGAATTQTAAGAAVGWKLRYAQDVWRMYREGGLEKMMKKPQRFGFGKLSSHQIADLQRYLAEFGGESLAQVQQIIEQRYAVNYGESGVCMLLKRLRIKLKTARPSNAKKDEAAVEAYKKTLRTYEPNMTITI